MTVLFVRTQNKITALYRAREVPQFFCFWIFGNTYIPSKV